MSQQGAFRVAFVPGVTPGKWLDLWRERVSTPLEATLVEEETQLDVLHNRGADMCFVRLPVDRQGLHVIPLYREVPVVVVPEEHLLTLLEEVSVGDLADERVLVGSDRLPGWADIATADPLDLPAMTMEQAIEVVASGAGVVVVPRSVARLHARKDVTTRPVLDAPESQIGLAWRIDLEDPRTETFVGIVRGRTARSTRGDEPVPESRPAKRTPAPRRAKPVPGKSGRTPIARKRRPR